MQKKTYPSCNAAKLSCNCRSASCYSYTRSIVAWVGLLAFLGRVTATNNNPLGPSISRRRGIPTRIIENSEFSNRIIRNTAARETTPPPALPNDYPEDEEEEESFDPNLTSSLRPQQESYAHDLYRRYIQQRHWSDPNDDYEEEEEPLTDIMEEEENLSLEPYDEENESRKNYDIQDSTEGHFAAESNTNPPAAHIPQKPIVYRYFGRHQTSNSVSTKDYNIPFIVLGPSVNHWQAIGEVLSSRGFSVMVCEVNIENQSEGLGIVKTVLEALKWRQAVVVGCDLGNIAALEAALNLSSQKHQVSGLILTGDLTQVTQFVNSLIQGKTNSTQPHASTNYISIDSFLTSYISCPSTIVWDGDLYTLPGGSKKKTLSDYELGELHRVKILGGGISPHRRTPEHFSWVLARFVEENLANMEDKASATPIHSISRGGYSRSSTIASIVASQNEWIRALLSEDGLAVTSRIISISFLGLIGARVMQFHYNRSLAVLSTCHAFVQSQKHAFMFLAKVCSDDWKRKNSFIRHFVTRITSFGGLSDRKTNRNHKPVHRSTEQQQEPNINWRLVGILDYEQVAA